MRIAECLGQDNAYAYFSIIGDEVTDKHANQEILAVCLRFVDNLKANPEVREVFFDFIYVERTTGESIAKGIVDCLFRRGIDIKKARGQAYDGASSMSSSRVGVQARIRLLSPRALYTHCNSHVLNLTIASSCKIPQIRNMVDSLNETFKFFNYSPKRQSFFETILNQTQETSKVRKLKGLCKTRWVERHTCYETFYDLYPKVCLCLEEILNPSSDNEGWEWDRETRIKAQGLLSTLTTFTHLISFIITKNALHCIKGIASKLQKNGRDVYEAYQMIDGVRQNLKEVRSNIDDHFEDWFEDAKGISESIGINVEMPRTVSRQAHRANIPAETTLNYYKRNTCIPFLDHIIQEMDTRFCEEDRPGHDLFHLIPSVICENSDLKLIHTKVQYWEDDLPYESSLINELQEWKRHWKSMPQEEHPKTLFTSYLAADDDCFPNIKNLLRIGSTMPVGSCEAERSFSCIRRLKTYLRSQMGEERLSGLALMNIHHNVEVDIDKVVDAFKAKHPRRLFSASVVFD